MPRRYVRRERSAPPVRVPLPKDRWQGQYFMEADGTVLEVVWDGRCHGTVWPEQESVTRHARPRAVQHTRRPE